MVTTTNIIQNIICLVNKNNKGSSFASPAYGWSGTRATINNSQPAEKNRAKPEKQKGKKEGGLGEGIFALLRLELERFRWRAKKLKNIEKIYLFWFRRSEAETGGNAPIYSGFCSKKVRTLSRKHRQFSLFAKS